MKFCRITSMIAVPFFMVIRLAVIAADQVSSIMDFDRNGIPFLKTIVSSGEMKAVFSGGCLDPSFFGFQSPFITVGPVYKAGLLSLIDRPEALSYGSRVFSESSGVALNTAVSGDHPFSFFLSPFPDYISVFLLKNSFQHVVTGVLLCSPFRHVLPFEIIFENTRLPAGRIETSWFIDEPKFEGAFLNNAALRWKIASGNFSADVSGGVSFSELTPPGWFFLFHSLLHGARFNWHIASVYRSRYYFSPNVRTARECMTIGSSVDGRLFPWLSVAASAGLKRWVIGPERAARVIHQFDGSAGFDVRLWEIRKMRTGFSASCRYEGPDTPADDGDRFSLNAEIWLEETRCGRIALAYKYLTHDERGSFSVRYAVEKSAFDLNSLIDYWIDNNTVEAAVRIAFRHGKQRLHAEMKIYINDVVSDRSAPFTVKMGFDCAL